MKELEITSLLLRFEQRTKRLEFTFELGASDFEIVAFDFDFFKFRLQAAHLVNAFLSIPACCKRICFTLLNAGSFRGEWTVFGG